MEGGGCDTPSTLKDEKSGSEESCEECCCEECRGAESAEDSTEQLPVTFTKLKDTPRIVFSPSAGQECLPPESLPVFQTVSPACAAEDLTVAIEDLHVRRAQLNAKKQRRCAFCRLHGFPVNMKGHKAFCQFREKCTCTGCTLIRCNQQVSKNQVRLRRQKYTDAEREGLTVGPGGIGEQHSLTHDASKKNPMCFKCWIHDSVRVRLKGHRTVCPYARCACSTCGLNAHRKWLTRQLRQLTGSTKDRGKEGAWTGVGGVATFHLPSVCPDILPSAGQYSASADMSLNSDPPQPSGHCTNSSAGFGVFPLRFHTVADWQLSPDLPTAPAVRQNVLSSLCTNQSPNGQVCQDTGCLVPHNKWLPYSPCQVTLPSSLSAMPISQVDTSHIVTVNNCNYNATWDATPTPSRATQHGSLCRWYPQYPPSFKTNDSGLMVMHTNTVDYL